MEGMFCEVFLLVLDEFVNHAVNVVRFELVLEARIVGFYFLPDVAVAFSGMIESDAFVPSDVGEEQGT